jgi:CotH kinase protein/Secretion system C-terminal sorting domain
VSLLGMPAENDWVLNTSYDDKTFLRDVLSYDLARRMGRYASRYRHCELVINDVYMGMYVLLEKIKVDKNRVNITKIKNTDVAGDDLTGGYIVKIDKTTGTADAGWYSNFASSVVNKSRVLFQVDVPKLADIVPPQLAYIKAQVNAMETALNKGDFLSPNADYKNFIDSDSFIDYFLLTELTKNIDGYRLSTYFYKNKDSKGGKFVMGPAWDYNLCYGNANYYDGWKTTDWVYDMNDTHLVQDGFLQPTWFKKLLNDTSYVRKAGQRWRSLRKTVFSGDRINNYLDSTATVISEGQNRDNLLWKTIGKYTWPNYYVGTTYQDELRWMKNWIQQRLAYMDSYLNTYGIVLANEEPRTPLKILNSYPNPSADEFTIAYEVLQAGQIKLQAVDMLGRVVAELVNQNQAVGQYQIRWKPQQTGTFLIDYQNNGVPVERVRVLKN